MNNNKKVLIIGFFIFAFLIVGASILYDRLSEDYAPEKLTNQNNSTPTATGETSSEDETQTPDFTVYDRDGNEIHLSDSFGKPIVVNFWASWCGPCKSEMPDFDDAYKKYGEDVVFLMVNMTDGSRETVETASEFISEQGYSFPVYYDTKASAAIAYEVYSLPTTLFINIEGKVVANSIGAISADELEQGINIILPKE